MVPRQNGFHGPDFPVTRVKTQGGLVSPTIFDVDNDVPTRHTTVGDVGGGQVSEVYGGGRLVPGETHNKDPMPGVCS